MAALRFDGRVAVVTGAGQGLGRAYALLLASLGASLVLNDYGMPNDGKSGSSRQAIDSVIKEIVQEGGKAVACYDSSENGECIIQMALKQFGRLDILINNSGVARNKPLSQMTEDDWNVVYRTNLYAAFITTKAAWEHFQKQKYGRIIMISSTIGLYGNHAQSNYGSAKMALISFGLSLAKEGANKNIKCNIVAPIEEAHLFPKSTLPTRLAQGFDPVKVAPFVIYLCHESCPDNGSLYEIGAGFAAKVRWERSAGALLKVDHPTFTPAAVAASLPKALSFSPPSSTKHPTTIGETDWMALQKQSTTLEANKQTGPLLFTDRVVLVTGAGGGLGRGYALMFAKLGAKVIVNDLGRNQNGQMLANLVVEEITRAGGLASADYHSVEEGNAIIASVIENYGRIDVLVNNAGILRDKSFLKMTPQEWNLVLAVHLAGTFKMTKAAWPHMVKQKYGRIINTCSAVGLYGNFGQANYSAAKAGILGFSQSLALEGLEHNILVNTIAPNAGTQMTATILPKDIVDTLKPEYVAPLVGYLAHESNRLWGTVFEVGSGWFGKVRLQRSNGIVLDHRKSPSLEEVAKVWNRLGDFSSNSVYPTSLKEELTAISMRLDQTPTQSGNSSSDPQSGNTLDVIFNGSSAGDKEDVNFVYGKRDVILYNLGVGCTPDDLKYVYERSSDLAVIPTFAVIPAFLLMMNVNMSAYAENYNPALLLHGEHCLEMAKPMPSQGKLHSEQKILQVMDKGKGCIVVIQVKTFDEDNSLVATNEGTIFLRDAKAKTLPDQGKLRLPAATQSVSIPNRKPDAITKQKIPENQAIIYRLNGDTNPLHM